MALIFDRKVPAGIIDEARSTLGDLAAVPDSRGGQSPLAKATVSNTPLPVYSLRLDALAGGLGPWDAGLADAEPESWRVFVMNGRNEPTGVADVTSSPGGAGGARFLSYTRGPQVAASGQVLTDAEDAEPLRSRTFQPGFLEIPGINVSAVWLKALDGQADVVIPVDPIPRFLSDRHNYTLREFLELARARAVQRSSSTTPHEATAPIRHWSRHHIPLNCKTRRWHLARSAVRNEAKWRDHSPAIRRRYYEITRYRCATSQIRSSVTSRALSRVARGQEKGVTASTLPPASQERRRGEPRRRLSSLKEVGESDLLSCIPWSMAFTSSSDPLTLWGVAFGAAMYRTISPRSSL